MNIGLSIVLIFPPQNSAKKESKLFILKLVNEAKWWRTVKYAKYIFTHLTPKSSFLCLFLLLQGKEILDKKNGCCVEYLKAKLPYFYGINERIFPLKLQK